MRTADAAGVDAVIVPRHGAAGLGPTVSKVAAGAAEQLPFVPVGNLGKVLAYQRQGRLQPL
jgi:23S rRNA (guanosine2251-2'-O)-methyltransferase